MPIAVLCARRRAGSGAGRPRRGRPRGPPHRRAAVARAPDPRPASAAGARSRARTTGRRPSACAAPTTRSSGRWPPRWGRWRPPAPTVHGEPTPATAAGVADGARARRRAGRRRRPVRRRAVDGGRRHRRSLAGPPGGDDHPGRRRGGRGAATIERTVTFVTAWSARSALCVPVRTDRHGCLLSCRDDDEGGPARRWSTVRRGICARCRGRSRPGPTATSPPRPGPGRPSRPVTTTTGSVRSHRCSATRGPTRRGGRLADAGDVGDDEGHPPPGRTLAGAPVQPRRPAPTTPTPRPSTSRAGPRPDPATPTPAPRSCCRGTWPWPCPTAGASWAEGRSR